MIRAAGLDWLSDIRSGRAESIAQRIADQTRLATPRAGASVAIVEVLGADSAGVPFFPSCTAFFFALSLSLCARGLPQDGARAQTPTGS